MTGRKQVAPPVVLDRFAVPSAPGNERLAMTRVGDALRAEGLSDAQLERLATAVAEATMNAIEHGNQSRPELPVEVEVTRATDGVVVTITDQGGAPPEAEPEVPDLVEKLAGRQRTRGWGLFLIENMVDEMDVSVDGSSHTVRLTMHATTASTTHGGSHGQL
jgi:anti-sigma regulatory factor (Ser/Thr protein kinase)